MTHPLVRGGSAERLRTIRPSDTIAPRPRPVSLRDARRRLEAAYGLLPAYDGRIAREMGRCLWLASLEYSLAARAAGEPGQEAAALESLRLTRLYLARFTWWMAQDSARTYTAAWERTH